MKPTKNSIALNGHGDLGLITEDEQQEVSYPDGTKALAWVGLHLTKTDKHSPGDFWCSRGPEIIGYLPNPKQRYRFVTDSDGDNYLIPNEKRKAFDLWNNWADNLWKQSLSDVQFRKIRDSYSGEDFTYYEIDGISDYTFENPRGEK